MKKYFIIVLFLYVIAYVGLSISGHTWNPVQWSKDIVDVAIPLLVFIPIISVISRIFIEIFD